MLIFSSFISSITSAMTTLRNLGAREATQLRLLRKWFKQRNVSRDLSFRVHRFVSVMMKKHKHVSEKDITILTLLSAPLQMELKTELFLPLLTVHPLFSTLSTKSEIVMRKMCITAIKQETSARGDVIFLAGERAQQMYFVTSGALRYDNLSDAARCPETDLSSGEWFSEAILWGPWVHRGRMRATAECELVVLNALEFRNVAIHHPSHILLIQSYARSFVKEMSRALQNEEAGPWCVSDLHTEMQSKMIRSLSKCQMDA
eukprot:gnl/TRDRNA2_/TRDRNA2_168952_c2_seq1.p1 gnl/TRDRNA2_/TRDRNA2_168952_c2~~gnl/TRDRNA2_/TRDRNA2_168952_c2_seq1.p1  ORF type:complete len:260 (-),score=35.09 gnl/TRDRNA2_/TRDRNA2_168952_c2_seq1:198-977(-)